MSNFLLGCLVGIIASRITWGPKYELVLRDSRGWFPEGFYPKKMGDDPRARKGDE